MKPEEILPELLLNNTTYKVSAGRRAKADAIIRSQFTCRRGCPKKEYLRCKLIRGHKRLMRQIKKNIKPEKTLNKFDSNNQVGRENWNQLVQCSIESRAEIEAWSKTEAGPLTDGKSKRKEKIDDTCKSFNMKFCQWYFSPLPIRKSYYYYTELLFAEFTPEILNDKFEFNCCNEEQHYLECYEKWTHMKKYINTFLIEDLELEPWFPERQLVPRLPNILEGNMFELIFGQIKSFSKKENSDTEISDEAKIVFTSEISTNDEIKQVSSEGSAFKHFKAII